MFSTIFVAGYGNSESEHWHRLWFDKTPNAYWVEQDDWNHPNKDKWIDKLEKTLLHIDTPILFIAHSIGCHTVVQWVKKYYKNQNIIAAMFVAPPDTTREDFPKEIVGFKHVAKEKLPFKSVCIISDNDPYATTKSSQNLANSWGSEALHVGAKGHINLASNLGEWEEGKNILEKITNDKRSFKCY